MSDIKHQYSNAGKAKDSSQLLIDSLKDQINSLENEIQFLREELKVKNHLVELTITSKKIGSSATYPSSQQISLHTQKISNEKRCCSVNITGNNNITITPKTQKDSFEISLESINNNDAHEEKAIATNTVEINKDMCDTQNNIVAGHMKKYAKKVNVTQLYHNCRKTQDKETIASLMRAPKMQVIMKILNSCNKKFHILLEDSMTKKYVVIYLPVLLIINTF